MQVRLENLSKVFSGKKGEKTIAVNQVNLTIPDGKLVGLLGPSGCGKSTTLYLISGLHKATEGKIFFGDQEVTNLPPENRGIGLVFQNYALYPHFTVRQNIRFPLENVEPKLSAEEMEKIVVKMAKLVDIEKLLNRKPKELSGGQQQRVAIARALAKTPQVLLLDEPLSNLDARLRLQTREEIKRIQRETGITTIFVTHDQEEAMSISDLMIVMKDGLIQQIDEPQTIYDEPANLFVAKFLGVPAINTFSGHIRQGKLFIQDIEMATGVAGIDRPVIVGVRPESFAIEKNKYPFLHVKVSFIEHIGRDISVIGSVAKLDKDVRIIIPLEFKASIKENATIPFSPKRIYLFEENGDRIQ
jgi:multiple sugar transport system ATP-binding protein